MLPWARRVAEGRRDVREAAGSESRTNRLAGQRRWVILLALVLGVLLVFLAVMVATSSGYGDRYHEDARHCPTACALTSLGLCTTRRWPPMSTGERDSAVWLASMKLLGVLGLAITLGMTYLAISVLWLGY